MIDSQTKQRIIDATNILDVVSDFISLRRSGVSYVGLCPFHSDRKPSFYVSPSKNVCKCFACGEGGSPIHFLMKHEQMSYNDALRYLAKKYHIEIVEREETDEEKKAASERQSLFILNEYAHKFFTHQLHESEEGRQIGLSYFRERGFTLETIQKFGLGYSPEQRDALTTIAIQAGYPLDRLVKVGLSTQYDDKPPMDRFRGRVIFPVHNLSGQYVAFGGRVMSKTDKTAKYVNSPESAIYSKSRELYGLYWAKRAISKADKCYLVEGYTDVISMHQAGIENVVSSSGTALTSQQIRLIRRFTEHITVLYDGDSAGIKAAIRGIDLLLEEGLDIKVVLLPEGEDPDSYAQKHGREGFLSYLDKEEVDFIHFKIALYQDEMKRDPIKRAELIKDILRSIALIPDAIRRTVLVQSSASRLKMNEGLLLSEVQKLHLQSRSSRSVAVAEPSPLISSTKLEHAPTPDRAISPEEVVTEEPDKELYAPHHYEISLLKLIVQQANDPMLALLEDDKGDLSYHPYDLGVYIYEELELDGILGDLSAVCLDMLTEVVEHCIPSRLNSADYFINHEQEVIRSLASNLLAGGLHSELNTEDKEDSKLALYVANLASATSEEEKQKAQSELEVYEQERERKQKISLGEKALWELDQIRMAIVLKNIGDIQKKMIDAERSGDTALVLELLKALQEENLFKQELAQTLGERTIKA